MSVPVPALFDDAYMGLSRDSSERHIQSLFDILSRSLLSHSVTQHLDSILQAIHQQYDHYYGEIHKLEGQIHRMKQTNNLASTPVDPDVVSSNPLEASPTPSPSPSPSPSQDMDICLSQEIAHQCTLCPPCVVPGYVYHSGDILELVPPSMIYDGAHTLDIQQRDLCQRTGRAYVPWPQLGTGQGVTDEDKKQLLEKWKRDGHHLSIISTSEMDIYPRAAAWRTRPCLGLLMIQDPTVRPTLTPQQQALQELYQAQLQHMQPYATTSTTITPSTGSSTSVLPFLPSVATSPPTSSSLSWPCGVAPDPRVFSPAFPLLDSGLVPSMPLPHVPPQNNNNNNNDHDNDIK